MSCPLCGLCIAEQDDIVEVDGRVMHVSCVESASGARPGWKHGDAKTWSEWARGTGWAGSVGG